MSEGNENVPPDDSILRASTGRCMNTSRLSCASPYSSKLPVCSSTSSEEASAEQAAQDEVDEKEAKRERRRNRVQQEIMATEQTYQKHLNLIAKYFEQPIRAKQLIPDHITVTIFSNIHQIIAINEELSGHLQNMSIGKAFLEMAPYLKLYSTYANNHERALATLMEWEQKCPELTTFRRSQEELEDMEGLKLNALLITPVQRIPRYKLLLEELIHYTPANDDDYPHIIEASKLIGAVADHINEHIKQQDNFMKMLAIQKSLSGPVAPRILTPGRIFIKDGPLKKVSRKSGRLQERMFFLFSDILLYAKSRLLESAGHPTYACCCILPLQHCMVSRVFGRSKGQGALFTVTCKTESLLLYADQKTVDNWIGVLTTAIGQFVKNRKSLRKESSAKTPLRKAALAKLTRMEKMEDPLTAAMKKNSPSKSPGKLSRKSRPVSSKSLASEDSTTNIGCLSPRKRLQNIELPRIDMGCLSPKSRLHRKKAKRTDSETGSECPGIPPLQQSTPISDNKPPRRSNTFDPPLHPKQPVHKQAWTTPTQGYGDDKKHRDTMDVSENDYKPQQNLIQNERTMELNSSYPIPGSMRNNSVDGVNDDFIDCGIRSGVGYGPSRSSVFSHSYDSDDMEHHVQRFMIDDGLDDEDTKTESEVSLTKSDLLSLFAAADAADSGLQSHLDTYSDSSCFRQTPNAVVISSPSKRRSMEYDYSNYMPKFANLYRTPVKKKESLGGRLEDVDEIYERMDDREARVVGKSPIMGTVTKRTSYKAAMSDCMEGDDSSVFDSPVAEREKSRAVNSTDLPRNDISLESLHSSKYSTSSSVSSTDSLAVRSTKAITGVKDTTSRSSKYTTSSSVSSTDSMAEKSMKAIGGVIDATSHVFDAAVHTNSTVTCSIQ